MKKKTETIWPDLWGRLNQPLTTEKEALEQLKSMVPLSDYGIEQWKKLTKEQAKKRVHNKRNNSV